jgi:hypothetical protein
MLDLPAGEGMLLSEFLVGALVHSPLLHLADATFIESARQPAADRLQPNTSSSNHGFLITNASDLLRLRAAARRLTGYVNIEATGRAQFVSKSRSSWVIGKTTTNSPR